MEFKRGDKISFYGKDSTFEGWFISYISKLSHDGKEPDAPIVRCVVQQRHGTGIILIKGNPKEMNRGWVEDIKHH